MILIFKIGISLAKRALKKLLGIGNMVIGSTFKVGSVSDQIITDMRGLNPDTGLLWTSAEIDDQLILLAAITPAISGYSIYVGDNGRTSASDAAVFTLVSPPTNDVIEPIQSDIEFVAVTTNYSSSSSSLVVNVPTGTQEGDTMIAFVNINSKNQSANTPTGWTLIDVVSGILPSATLHLFRKVAGVSEPSNYTFDGWLADRNKTVITTYRNVHLTSPIDVYNIDEVSSTILDATGNSITTTEDNTMLLFAIAYDTTNNIGITVAPSGMTEKIGASNPQTIHLLDELIATTGATGNRVLTPSVNANKFVIMMALKKA